MTIDARPALEPRQEPADQVDRAVEVGADLGREVEALQVLAGEIDLAQAARVADQEVDTRMSGKDIAGEGAHRRAIGNVDRVTFDAGKFGFEPLELLRIAPAGDDRVAARPQARDERLADSRRSAAHHGDGRRGCLGFLWHGFSVSCVGAPGALLSNSRENARGRVSRNEAAAKSDRSAVAD